MKENIIKILCKIFLTVVEEHNTDPSRYNLAHKMYILDFKLIKLWRSHC